jgi:hypothetical protein
MKAKVLVGYINGRKPGDVGEVVAKETDKYDFLVDFGVVPMPLPELFGLGTMRDVCLFYKNEVEILQD